MSQRECAGFNGAGFTVSAVDPVGIAPEAWRGKSRGFDPSPPLFLRSRTTGVCQCASVACADSGLPLLCPQRFALNSSVADSLRQSRAAGVAQGDTNATVRRELSVLPAGLFPFCAGVPAIGVGHPVASIADVRGTDARSRKRDTPKGVAQSFQVRLNKVEPRPDSLTRNLLSKDD
jgi:hypothetical protein